MRLRFSPLIWTSIGLALVLAAGAIVLPKLSRPTELSRPAGAGPESQRRPPANAPRPTLVADPVDGEPVTTGAADRRPIAIMIDNFPEARPQWGLSSASRIYEAITEGGITRYMAVFSGQDADRIGPVRSVRTQYIDYALELDAALGHVGGNADALSEIRRLPVKDLDEFRYADGYRRIPMPHVALEHTMFTSTPALRALVDQQGRDDEAADARRTWKDDAPPARRPAEQRLEIDFSSTEYAVTWTYRPATNDYARTLAGVADVDAATGRELTARTIVIAVVPRTHGRTQIGEDTWTFADIGSGPAWVVQDGTVVKGRWEKESSARRLRLFDGDGREIAFNRGPQWVEIIPPEVPPSFQLQPPAAGLR